MLKIIAEKWGSRQHLLHEKLAHIDMTDLCYLDLVKITFDTIYNNEYDTELNIDTDRITKVDDGHYQGTLLFLLPFDRYQPSECEYLMTYVNYGSCSVCDTLLSIIDYEKGQPNEEQIKDLMLLCHDILIHTIQPYYKSAYNYYREELKEIDNDKE